jgi:hypothetical protein
MVEHPASDSPETPTASSEPDTTLTSSTFASPDRIAVPPHAVEILRDCIDGRKSAPVINEKVREALVLICDEAHKSDAMPEQVIIAVKEMCTSLPEYQHIRGARERGAFLSSLVTIAIEEYYRG